jgi:hypothetical protein
VLRKFLTPTQQQDFDRKRSFVCQGAVTGHTYIVTSRWAESVERLGVLHDANNGNRVCSSNDGLPPSEECLSMKFIVEGPWEQRWLDATMNHYGDSVPTLDEDTMIRSLQAMLRGQS